jgi:hypothetical protein
MPRQRRHATSEVRRPGERPAVCEFRSTPEPTAPAREKVCGRLPSRGDERYHSRGIPHLSNLLFPRFARFEITFKFIDARVGPMYRWFRVLGSQSRNPKNSNNNKFGREQRHRRCVRHRESATTLARRGDGRRRRRGDRADVTGGGGRRAAGGRGAYARQGLTLVHFSAQLEPYLTQENALHTLSTP